MNRREFIRAVAAESGLSPRDAERAVDAILETIKRSLKSGDDITLAGFGTFSVRARAARAGINPRTGQKLRIKASRLPTLRAAKGLKEAVDPETDDPGPSIRLRGSTK